MVETYPGTLAVDQRYQADPKLKGKGKNEPVTVCLMGS